MYFAIYSRIPFALNFFAGPVFSYVAFLMNTVILLVLFDKEIKTPSTILLQGLAIADGLTSICIYGFEPLFKHFYEEIVSSNKSSNFAIWLDSESSNKTFSMSEVQKIVSLKYPYCLGHYLLSQLAETFHMVSILITASIGIQKIIAVVWPVWCRTTVTIKKSTVICYSLFIFSVVVNMPKLFVVSIYSDKNDSTCILSKPVSFLEKYVLTFHPIFYSVILFFCMLAMIVSTICIIFKLCKKRKIKMHTSASKSETMSCLLTVFVMTVFLLSEIPRLYINTIIFKTYHSDLADKNIAWSKVRQEIHKKSSECYRDVEDNFLMKLKSDFNFSETGCFNASDRLQSYIPIIDSRIDRLIFINKNYGKTLSLKLVKVYQSIVDNIITQLSAVVIDNLQKRITKIATFLICNNVIDQVLFLYINEYLLCDGSVVNALHDEFPALILGITPYSETVNYLLNITWRRSYLTLESVKILTEVLKFCTVFACASNFVIYIAMSRKLREALSKKLKYFKCWENIKEPLN